MNDQGSVRVDMDDLIRDYLQNLNVTLRAFNAAEGLDFLSTFVPSDDPTLSLMDLVDLARDADLRRLTVAVSPETLAKLDVRKLRAGVGDWRQRQLADKTELEFVLKDGHASGL
jgi:hypothetical protein